MIKRFLSVVRRQLSTGNPLSRFRETVVLDSQPADSLDELRERMWWLISDCDGPASSLVSTQITHADLPEDLWALRGAVFQCVAQAYSQAEAIDRLNRLSRAFYGWMPDKMLMPDSKFVPSKH
jgi:hypothetical protein